MPAKSKNNAAGSSSSKKKKKGHAPAHQNKFAFKHNPKSKTTAKILSSPNVHVCQRCYDKIEWRKQYRKYKPRTQPGTCNGCKKRNVLAAYHTICESCTRTSAKAKELIMQHCHTNDDDDDNNNNDTQTQPEDPTTNKKDTRLLRACAMCVKEIALPDPNDGDDVDDRLSSSMTRLRLRDRKTIERQATKAIEKEKEEKRLERMRRKQEKEEGENATKNRATSETKGGDDGDDDDVSYGNYDDDDDSYDDYDDDFYSSDEDDDNDYKSNSNNKKKSEETNDPFLQAVGGADKLLTGAAYQQMLLQQQQN